MKKITLLALTCILFISCGSGFKYVSGETQNNLIPEVGQITTAQIGETLVKKEFGYSFNAITITEDIKPTTTIISKELKRGEIYVNRAENNDYLLYTQDEPKQFENRIYYGVAIPKNGGQAKIYSYGNVSTNYYETSKPIEFQKSKLPDLKREYSNKEFIYNGKIGNGMKFIYREYVNDFARPAFTQELQYDLNDGNVVGFKNLRIEIIKANNTNIEYKVISSF